MKMAAMTFMVPESTLSEGTEALRARSVQDNTFSGIKKQQHLPGNCDAAGREFVEPFGEGRGLL